ncbi:hypothetical protein CY34DRAFT_395301 [Suillus luteus UH-Slu-Lm8-n1]|uniref:Unplaced genomic scaffold CY34scaffold_264, whole genome shotgun sequence n=1 Tax=Suillus luteus UH-Slu-Lm8-n1 TaxID=930992 RepID=A0A0D0AJT9_9AGAM|nr:hypothetical protein CY34DRAFT_395301 [Suillus luteus UH-Slu-Lm8-n1]
MDTKLPTASKFKSNVELYRWVRDSFHKILYELGDVLRNGNLTRPLIQLVVIERTHRSGCPTEQPWCGTACMDGTRTSGGRISGGGMTGRSSIELPSTCHLRSTTCKVLCMALRRVGVIYNQDLAINSLQSRWKTQSTCSNLQNHKFGLPTLSFPSTGARSTGSFPHSSSANAASPPSSDLDSAPARYITVLSLTCEWWYPRKISF